MNKNVILMRMFRRKHVKKLTFFFIFRFQGKIRVGTRIFQDPQPNQERVSLSQIPHYNEENYGYVSNSISCGSENEADDEADPVTSRSMRRSKNYQYPQQCPPNITTFGTSNQSRTTASRSSKKYHNSHSRNKKSFGKKSRFNMNLKNVNKRPKQPRKCPRVCPTCNRPWDREEQSESELSADEFVSANRSLKRENFFF